MNPFSRFKKFIIGDALAATDDVFEKARIDLVFDITCFFLVLGIGFYGNLVAHHYTWLICITTIGVISLPTVLIILKKTKNLQWAAWLFLIEQIVVGLFNQILKNFQFNGEAAFWSIFTILFAFFIFGKRWGWIITAYVTLTIFLGIYNEETQHSLIHFSVPKEQLPPPFPYIAFFPMAICVYSIYRALATRVVAEKQISLQKSLLEKSNKKLEAKNEDIISSITYAQTIQYEFLHNE